MSELRMRLARGDDAAAAARLCRRVMRRWIVPEQPREAIATLEQTFSTRVIRQRIQAGLRFHLAFLDDVLIGVAASRDDRHVFHLFVGTRYQGRGVGRRLWERLRKDCERRSGTRVFTVNASAVAVPVYLRLGFVVDHDPARKPRGKVVSTPMIYRVGRQD